MKPSLGTLFESNSYVGGVLAGAVASLVLLAMAWPFVDHMPLYDELVHFLAARNVRDHGLPMIADGFYERAKLFTFIVAGAITSFGDTLVAARIPSLVASAGLLITMVVWLTRRVDLLAGIVAAGVLCILPVTLDLAILARFYMLHALLVMGMSIALYEAAVPSRRWLSRVALGVLAAILLLLALQLQITTLIAFAAVVAGIGALLMLDHWPTVRAFVRRYPAQTVAGSTLVLATGFALLWSMGFITDLRSAPFWLEGRANRFFYYPVVLAQSVPLFWPLFPAAVIVALLSRRRLAVFCMVVLLSALVVHSIAAAKALRYIYYVLPFFCVIWGCAVSAAAAFARQSRPRSIVFAGQAAALALTAVVVALSQEGQRAARLVLGRATAQQAVGFAGEAEWSPALPVLQSLLSSADRVVTSNAMKALYYLGRYDYELNATSVRETVTGGEFGTDARTGRLAIGTAESTAQVLAMTGRAVVILEEEKIGEPVGVSAAAIDEIVARCSSVDVPPTSGIRVWTCPAVH